MLVYNGEIYNFKEIKNKIKDRWIWKTKSDTEVLLAAWILWKEKSLKKFVGMFSFVIYDQKSKNIYAARDRFGIKPLYYHYKNSELILSSEIKPILKYVNKSEANLPSIRTFLELGLYDHSKDTFFKDIYSLLPGTLMHYNIERNALKIEKWYNFSSQVPNLKKLTMEEILTHTEKLLSQSIESHLVSDVPVGLNISGGVDSSMLFKLSLNSLKNPFLFNLNYKGYEELNWINQFSKGYNLNIIDLDSKTIFENLKETVFSQNEPFGSLFVCGYNVLYKEAR